MLRFQPWYGYRVRRHRLTKGCRPRRSTALSSGYHCEHSNRWDLRAESSNECHRGLWDLQECQGMREEFRGLRDVILEFKRAAQLTRQEADQHLESRASRICRIQLQPLRPRSRIHLLTCWRMTGPSTAVLGSSTMGSWPSRTRSRRMCTALA